MKSCMTSTSVCMVTAFFVSQLRKVFAEEFPISQNPFHGLLEREEIPQFVVITWEDDVHSYSADMIRPILDLRHKSNCAIKTTFFVSIQNTTSCAIVQGLYKGQHEIASHTYNHVGRPSNEEILSANDYLVHECGIPREEIRGFRAPYLDYDQETFNRLRSLGFTYDSSIKVVSDEIQEYGRNNFWPFTFTEGFHKNVSIECQHPPCDNLASKENQGLWEVPLLNMWNSDQNPNEYINYYGPSKDLFQENLERRYNGNRAPLGLHFQAKWMLEHAEIFKSWIESVLESYDDVYFVTNFELLQWMRNPIPKSSFEPKCDGQDPVCLPFSAYGCYFGTFNPSTCSCDCNEPFCQDEIGLCLNAGLDCRKEVNDSSKRNTTLESEFYASQQPFESFLSTKSIPQFITITWDDSIHSYPADLIRPILNLRHKNNCAIKTTFFASIGNTTKCEVVKGLYKGLHEIASHTYNHVARPSKEEILSANDYLVNECGIPRKEIRGFRAPYLDFDQDTLDHLHSLGFMYDSSTMLNDNELQEYGRKNYWPFTFNAGDYEHVNLQCTYPPCDHNNLLSNPGLWEIPMYVMWNEDKDPNVIMDYISPTADLLQENFERRYHGNRAPLGQCSKNRLISRQTGSSHLLKEERYRKQMKAKFSRKMEQLAGLLKSWFDDEGSKFDANLLSEDVRMLVENSDQMGSWIEQRKEFMHLRTVKPDRKKRRLDSNGSAESSSSDANSQTRTKRSRVSPKVETSKERANINGTVKKNVDHKVSAGTNKKASPMSAESQRYLKKRSSPSPIHSQRPTKKPSVGQIRQEKTGKSNKLVSRRSPPTLPSMRPPQSPDPNGRKQTPVKQPIRSSRAPGGSSKLVLHNNGHESKSNCPTPRKPLAAVSNNGGKSNQQHGKQNGSGSSPAALADPSSSTTKLQTSNKSKVSASQPTRRITRSVAAAAAKKKLVLPPFAHVLEKAFSPNDEENY